MKTFKNVKQSVQRECGIIIYDQNLTTAEIEMNSKTQERNTIISQGYTYELFIGGQRLLCKQVQQVLWTLERWWSQHDGAIW